ncbi:MAG: type II secretion system F family protein [Alicyclobacillaceae bacterium]|nr:type II secretion system F family protein [Alicyclobacillaceae bacterium]
MPEFRYTVLDAAGRRRRGRLRAADAEEAELSLRRAGLYVLEVAERNGEAWWKREVTLFGGSIKTRDFAVFCRQFATLVRAGITLLDSLRILAAQTESKPLRSALEKAAAQVAQGWPLSEAAARDPKAFPPVFVSMIRAGEAGGNMEGALDRLARYFERSHFTREKIRAALTYPTIVGVVAVAVTVFLLVRIVPTFVSMFQSYHVAMPLPTRIVIGVSHAAKACWWLLLLAVLALVGLHRLLVRRPGYRRLADRLLFQLPVIGQMLRTLLMAEMARTMSSLLSSAVPMTQVLHLTGQVVRNTVVSDTLRQASERLQVGGALSESLRSNRLIPPLVSEMVAIGEQTGELDFVLQRLADFYEVEAEVQADRLKSTLEPVMIVVLAVVVGTIVLSVILPSFRLLQSLQ